MIITLLWIIIALIVFIGILLVFSRNNKTNNTYIDISKCIAEITALQIEVESMKTSNTLRTTRGDNTLWEANDFNIVANLMRKQIDILESLKKK